MKLNIIPQPKEITVGDSTVFTLTDGVGIRYGDGCESAYRSLVSFLDKRLKLRPDGYGKETIILKIDPDVSCNEGYTLGVTYDCITVTGHDSAGAFYGVQTLCQLFISGRCKLPEIKISDCPDLSYRGFLLDSSRYFYKKEDVFAFLDMMAMHKLNVFHWHLTDDQGWRVELYNHLLLAQIGSRRAYTNFGKTPHSGFYSKEDIKEIIDYAHERFITVVPEIDSPGHVVSAIAAYPELSCFNRDLPVATHTGVKHDVLCVGKESTFDFMFSVFDEIIEMFPDEYIHIGGDEVPTVRWKVCPNCQKLMKEKGFKDESQLHSYYLNRIAEYIKSKGKKVIMWGCENEGDYDSGIVSEYWDVNENADGKRKYITATNKAYYLDFPYGKTSLKNSYEYKIKVNPSLLGAECCLWTEYVPDMKRAGYLLLPRLAAFSEKTWRTDEDDFDGFINKMPDYYRFIDGQPLKPAPLRHTMPNPIRGLGTVIWFERRQLHWQGLHNIIDDKKVEKLSKKSK